MKFIDEAKIVVQGGDGGDGCASFRREKYVPRGGPDGGNGGKGGDIALYADPNKSTLLDYHYQRQLKAKRGAHGRGKDQHGAAGEGLRVPVPVGTVIWEEPGHLLLGDLDRVGKELIIVRGGRGGRGNASFRSSRRQAPRDREEGQPGEQRTIVLELKLLADVGLVGLPNAGKSSLLTAISAAHPKVADYPFTTKAPALGVISLSDHRTFTVADLPGLIEGASQGAGMGYEFLRHVERTRILLHMLDLSEVVPGEEAGPFETIENELRSYDSTLLDRPRLVVLTKIDLPAVQERSYDVAKQFTERGFEVHTVSAVTKENLDKLVERTWQLIHQ